MKLFTSILFVCAALTASFAQQQGKSQEIIYVGTYSDRGSEGIYVFQFDRSKGALKQLQTVEDGKNPNFLAVHPQGKYLYAVYGEGSSEAYKKGSVAAYQVDPATGKLTLLNEQSSNGQGPCHVSVDPKGRFAYVSNYGSGSLAVYPIQQDGSLGKASDVVQHKGSSVNPDRQKEPHMHSIIPAKNGKFIYASDLGMDKVMVYAVDQKTGKLSAASHADNTPGAGPRHFALHPNGKFAFSLEELSSTINAFKVDKATGALTPLERVPMLPKDFEGKNSAADIHVSPDGKFLYASNRGHDSLVIYAVDPATGKLTLVGFEKTHGAHPRNFYIDKKGEYLFVANRDDDNVVEFRRDQASGKLTYVREVKVPMAVCIKQLSLK